MGILPAAPLTIASILCGSCGYGHVRSTPSKESEGGTASAHDDSSKPDSFL
eukprot:COSAG01_NODE_44815_length_415_cov_0.965190_2_plen_50_part_01